MLKPIIQNKNIYPSLLWQRGINIFRHPGKVIIVGGEKNSHDIINFCEVLFQSQIGKFTLAIPEKFLKQYSQIVPPENILPLPSSIVGGFLISGIDKIIEIADEYNLMVLGIGLSESHETSQFIAQLLDKIQIPILCFNLDLKSKNQNIAQLIIKNNDFSIFDAEKLIQDSQGTVIALTPKESWVISPEKNIITHFETKDSEIVILALISLIWAININKPFEAACTGSYLAKIWSENFKKISEIGKMIKKVEKEIEGG